jgi:hypothetical protein
MLERDPPTQAGDQASFFAYHVREPRRRTYLSGKLIYRDGGLAPVLTLDCAIRDISEGGARITLDRRHPLPPEVFLISVKHGIVYQAHIMWMQFPARGLKFLHAYVLKGAMPDELMFLKKISVDLGARSGIELVG